MTLFDELTRLDKKVKEYKDYIEKELGLKIPYDITYVFEFKENNVNEFTYRIDRKGNLMICIKGCSLINYLERTDYSSMLHELFHVGLNKNYKKRKQRMKSFFNDFKEIIIENSEEDKDFLEYVSNFKLLISQEFLAELLTSLSINKDVLKMRKEKNLRNLIDFKNDNKTKMNSLTYICANITAEFLINKITTKEVLEMGFKKAYETLIHGDLKENVRSFLQ